MHPDLTTPVEYQPILYTRVQAAKSLSISERTFMDLVRQGQIRFVKVGKGCVRYPLKALQNYVAELERQVEEQDAIAEAGA